MKLRFGGPALGASIGLEVADLIMFINSKEVLDGFLKKNPGRHLLCYNCFPNRILV